MSIGKAIAIAAVLAFAWAMVHETHDVDWAWAGVVLVFFMII